MILLISPKTAYATQRLVEEAGKAGVGIEQFDVHELAEKNFDIDVTKYEALHVRQANPYFSEIIVLAKRFQNAGKFVVDSEMILSGFETSKTYMYKQLEASNIPIPKTWPLAVFNSEILNLKSAIFKWVYGFGGHDTHLVRNQEEFTNIIGRHPKGEWLAQEYIEADFEYQVMTVGYKALPLILRFKISDLGFKADLHHYSIFKAEQLPQVVKVAEAASKATGRGLAKVDILQKGDKFYVLEVNRSPSLLPFEPYSKLNVAGIFLKHILVASGK